MLLLSGVSSLLTPSGSIVAVQIRLRWSGIIEGRAYFFTVHLIVAIDNEFMYLFSFVVIEEQQQMAAMIDLIQHTVQAG